ncbi:MAG: NAD-dependent epimerase/dehydratase family protein [Planctomycetota bacterium]
MKVLFLGGTGMLGPHIIEHLLSVIGSDAAAINSADAIGEDPGVQITVFNRSQRPNSPAAQVHTVRGDRSDLQAGLDPLKQMMDHGHRWDVVIDTASVNTWVEQSTALLESVTERYIYISSLSVYAENATAGQDESAAVATMPDDVAATITDTSYDMQYYGAVKARCEAAVQQHFGYRSLIFRPGLLVGPRDTTHRFTWWPWRIRRGGRVLAPGSPDDPVQFIDVRDFAAFIVNSIIKPRAGILNVNGPVNDNSSVGMTIGSLLEKCRSVTGSNAKLIWADADWLQQHDVHMWSHMPVWIPPGPETGGFHTRSIDKAVRAGLKTRPVEQTIRDTLDWFDHEFLPKHQATADDDGGTDEWFFGPPRPGLSREQDDALLRELT